MDTDYSRLHINQVKADELNGKTNITKVSDTTRAVFKGNPEYPEVEYYHKHSYWIDTETKNLPSNLSEVYANAKISSETFAHMFEACFDSDKIKLMEHYLPNAWIEFQKMLNDIDKLK